jgi:hypothetical protein
LAFLYGGAAVTENHQRFSQRRSIAAAVAAAALLLPLAVIRAQSTATADREMHMPELLSGKTIPLQLQMKDQAGGEWRRVTAVGKSISTTTAGSPSTLSAAPVYTRGQTVRVDGESFLVLYTLQSLGTKDTVTA